MSVVGINAAFALMVHRARVYVPVFLTCLALFKRGTQWCCTP